MGEERGGPATAGGWRRWEPLLGTVTWPVSLRMAAVAEIGPGQRVLDVGCGMGDPTLQVAVLVGPHGRVVGLDLSEAMLAAARERAAALGLAHVEFRAGDVRSAPLEPEGFDAVLGRWSLIFLADVVAVLARLRAALVPGGRIAVAGWAPPDSNPWFTIAMEEAAALRPVAAPDPGAPGPFHLSTDGALARALLAAGFQAVQQERVLLSLFARDGAECWAMAAELAGPLAPALADLSPAERARLVEAVGRRVEPFRTGDVLRIPGQAQVAWGRV
jgi:SAM-dependent methyltransferase